MTSHFRWKMTSKEVKLCNTVLAMLNLKVPYLVLLIICRRFLQSNSKILLSIFEDMIMQYEVEKIANITIPKTTWTWFSCPLPPDQEWSWCEQGSYFFWSLIDSLIHMDWNWMFSKIVLDLNTDVLVLILYFLYNFLIPQNEDVLA